MHHIHDDDVATVIYTTFNRRVPFIAPEHLVKTNQIINLNSIENPFC